jgi:uncharacterized membrane protein HdeD (DUF308 family)
MTDLLLADPEPNTAAPPAPQGSRARPKRRRRLILAGLLAVAAGYSWFASDLDVSGFAPLVVGVPMLLGAVAVFRSWIRHDRTRTVAPARHRRRFGGLHHRAVLAWSVLAALLIGWELRELTGSPRVDYPTVTSIVSAVTSFQPVYALAFLAWLVVGYKLILRNR